MLDQSYPLYPLKNQYKLNEKTCNNVLGQNYVIEIDFWIKNH